MLLTPSENLLVSYEIWSLATSRHLSPLCLRIMTTWRKEQHVCTHTCTRTFTWACSQASCVTMFATICIHTFAHKFTCMHTCSHVHSHVCIVCSRVCVHMHVYISAHLPSHSVILQIPALRSKERAHLHGVLDPFPR